MNSIVLVFFKYIEVLPRQWSPSGVQTIFLEIHQEFSPRCDMDDRLVFSYLYVSGVAVFQVVPGFNKDGVPKATGISNPCWLYLTERQGARNPTIYSSLFRTNLHLSFTASPLFPIFAELETRKPLAGAAGSLFVTLSENGKPVEQSKVLSNSTKEIAPKFQYYLRGVLPVGVDHRLRMNQFERATLQQPQVE